MPMLLLVVARSRAQSATAAVQGFFFFSSRAPSFFVPLPRAALLVNGDPLHAGVQAANTSNTVLQASRICHRTVHAGQTAKVHCSSSAGRPPFPRARLAVHHPVGDEWYWPVVRLLPKSQQLHLPGRPHDAPPCQMEPRGSQTVLTAPHNPGAAARTCTCTRRRRSKKVK